MTELKEFTIDGAKISSIQGFLNVFGNALTPETKWALATNLDAFDDILTGGFGTPDEGFVLRWKNSDASRKLLGHKWTKQNLRGQMLSCIGEDRVRAKTAWLAARSGQGPGDFDMLIDLKCKHGPRGECSASNVHLMLE